MQSFCLEMTSVMPGSPLTTENFVSTLTHFIIISYISFVWGAMSKVVLQGTLIIPIYIIWTFILLRAATFFSLFCLETLQAGSRSWDSYLPSLIKHRSTPMRLGTMQSSTACSWLWRFLGFSHPLWKAFFSFLTGFCNFASWEERL